MSVYKLISKRRISIWNTFFWYCFNIEIIYLRELIEGGFNKVNHRIDIIETDVSSLKKDMKLIKSLPTIKREIKELEN